MLVLPFTSHMSDEILVEYAGMKIDAEANMNDMYKIAKRKINSSIDTLVREV